jgi:hypothetical protein
MTLDPITEERLLAELREQEEAEEDRRRREELEKRHYATEWGGQSDS